VLRLVRVLRNRWLWRASSPRRSDILNPGRRRDVVLATLRTRWFWPVLYLLVGRQKARLSRGKRERRDLRCAGGRRSWRRIGLLGLDNCRRGDLLIVRGINALLGRRARSGWGPSLCLGLRGLGLRSRRCLRRRGWLSTIDLLLLLLKRRRLARNTHRRSLGRRSTPLLLRIPGRAHTGRHTRPDIDMCRGRGHPSFAMDVSIPSRDRDLVILGLRLWRADLASLLRWRLLADWESRFRLKLSLGWNLGPSRTAVRHHTRAWPSSLLLLLLLLLLLRLALGSCASLLRSHRRLPLCGTSKRRLGRWCRRIGVFRSTLEGAHERRLGALLLLGLLCGLLCGRSRACHLAAKQQLGECALLLLLRLAVRRGPVRAARSELLAELMGLEAAGLGRHPRTLAGGVPLARRHLSSLSSGGPDTGLVGLLGRWPIWPGALS
jgi:hypothetical protein